MRRNLNVIGLLVLTLIAGLAFGTIIKETKQGQSIEFYTNESGTVAKSAELTPSGTLKVNEVTDLAGTGTPPGMIPIGGMVAVMPGVTGAWQPPATTVVKDGFMRADGATVADAASPMNGQVLPNMVNSFARGATTSSIVPVGGSDNITPTGTNTLSAFTGDAEVRTNWFKSQAISASNPQHYHSATASLASDLYFSATSGTGSNTLNANPFIQPSTVGGADHVQRTPEIHYPGGSSVISIAQSGGVGWLGQYHNHTVAGAITGYAGCQGYSGCVSGDGAQTVAFSGNNNNMEQWAATGSYTPSGTMTQPTFTGDSQTNMPVYNNVVWVIRVK